MRHIHETYSSLFNTRKSETFVYLAIAFLKSETLTNSEWKCSKVMINFNQKSTIYYLSEISIQQIRI